MRLSPRSKPAVALTITAMAALLGVTACSGGQRHRTTASGTLGLSSSTAGSVPAASPSAGSGETGQAPRSALSVLMALTIKGRAAKTGYDRARFGDAWTDDNAAPLGHNGCDTRNDILGRDLSAVAYKPGTNRCAVLTGELRDPYSGQVIAFVRGRTSSADVQIDHVVALSDAWQTGAQGLSLSRRTDFANDPLNLLAVDGSANESKGDGDAATWLPPHKVYRCAYVARQVAVKDRYNLWITPAEHSAIARVLSKCPGQPAPREARSAPDAPSANPKPPASVTASASPSQSSADVYYANCDAVRAARAAPIHRNDPGYRSELDGDGDGIGCE